MTKRASPICSAEDHRSAGDSSLAMDPVALDRCARIFRAMGEISRLRLIARLAGGAACVGELAEAEGEAITTISQRLRVLRADNIVGRRRQGKHVLYFLADRHMQEMVANGLAHAAEAHSGSPSETDSQRSFTPKGSSMMTEHTLHANHTHEHGSDCGHATIEHDGHVDFLHDGHMHHPHEDHIDEHTLEVSAANPATCTKGHACAGHDAQHMHGESCGHEAVPHGDHVDYVVNGHLHHQHQGHCDNHGNVTVMQ